MSDVRAGQNMQVLIRSQVWRRLAEAVGADTDDSEVEEAGPPPIPPRRPTMGASIGAGVTSRVAGAGSEPIRLTVGHRQMEFSPQEFVELIDSGQLQGMVSGGQVRKLPGV